ncbi:MAG: hypothetical protein HYW25_01870 [Candidatus Aenigmarchaeota archaeon]|nr:hypothetical protein [Candidatus Aenigmarchaeota archaeon]
MKQFTEHVDGKISGFESVYAKIARTESGYDIVIGNYLGDKIDVSIEATNSDPEQVSGSVQKDSEGFFAFVSSGTSEITIEYKTPIKSWTESLTTSQGDNEKMLYDFVLIDDSSEIRRKGLVEG